MQPASLLTIYCVLVGVASLGGGWLPSVLKLTHDPDELLGRADDGGRDSPPDAALG